MSSLFSLRMGHFSCFSQIPRSWALLLVLAFGCYAQADRATLTGTVTDATNSAISDAKISLRHTSTGFVRQTVTNQEGIYLFPGLPVGEYEVTAEKEGFKLIRSTGVLLTVGQRATVNLRMEVGTVTSQVEVVAEAVGLDKMSAEIGGVVSGSDLSGIPLNGRNWASFMLLAPGAVNTGEGNQNTIRYFGRSRDENNFTFDGVDATGVKDPRQEANLRLNISLDSIAEFRVSSALYTAETGGGAGAQVNLVSKSGTNELHGGLFEFFRNDKLDARRPIDVARPPFRLNQFGGNVGGPIRKDKTFYFVNFEGLRQRLAQTFIGFVPSAEFRARAAAASPAIRPVMEAYRPGTARTADPNIDQLTSVGSQPWTENSGLVKVDHRFSSSTSMFVRYNVDDGVIDEIRNALLETRTSNFRTQNATIQFQHVFSPTVLSESKLGMNRSALNRKTNGTFGEGVTIPGFIDLQVDRKEVEIGTSYSLVQTLAWTRGRHAFKFGGEIRKVDLIFSDTGSIRTSFADRESFLQNRANSISIAGANPSRKVLRPYYFAFAQDEVKLAPTFTMSLGARYEYYSVARAADGAGRVLDLWRCGGFCPPGTPWYFPDRNNIAPRVGLAWAPGRFQGRTVFRLGYGIFYGPGQLDDVNAALDSIPETFSLSQRDQPALSFPAAGFAAQARSTGVAPRSLQRDRRDGYSQQWTFSIQQQLPYAFVAQAAYVGNNAHHQFNRTFINVIDPATGRRPFPNFSNIGEKQNHGNSNFNGLQVSLNRAARTGFSWQMQYMWSHTINDNSGAGDGGQWMISDCRRCDRGDADWDVRHTYTSAAVYSLPFGKGKRFGPASGVAGALISGWEISGLGTARTGRPFSITVNRSAADLPNGVASTPGDSAPAQRPDYVGGPLYPATRTPDQWLNLAAFRVPARGTWGNLSRNSARGPGLWQVDLAAGKTTPLGERFGLEFRAEMFNLFNRAQYGLPNANISQPAQFGRITSVVNNTPTGAGGPRQVQFMLRLKF
ncbi:MAG: TonB-dependent receptor [Bryobacteraceae bacterium]|nr:TonB-dependent receptor [Bryobacteraceae bacterium]MDW8378211.1 TonB-dependent receptor [Bryobacterales bacterium]